uniref:Tf2-1-like SH3-like domain-containing protein n=1 Tax=Cajanus cajan TaxID=3821 RepID=A0A151U3C1_CAJCA|nr:hypothetical protein KK1_006451 [Cajanus cajan]
MVSQDNKNRKDVTFEVGDWVLLRLQPYRQVLIRRRHHHKLSHKFYSPFKVRCHIGNVTYDLELPPHSRIHSVFHVSLLRPYFGTKTNAPFTPIPRDLSNPPDDTPLSEPNQQPLPLKTSPMQVPNLEDIQ